MRMRIKAIHFNNLGIRTFKDLLITIVIDHWHTFAHNSRMKQLIVLLFASSLLMMTSAYEVLYAVNCGGPRHIDRNGIKYRKDDNIAGVASDYGKGLTIARVPPEDQILYQTERYHYRDFSYDIPISSEGDYFVVLKFAEVYFQRPDEKVTTPLIMMS